MPRDTLSRMQECANHPRLPANKQCTRCRRLWCDGCVKRITVGDKRIESCPRCLATVREPEPGVPGAIDEGVLRNLARPFSVEALITAVAIAVPAWLAQLLPMGLLGTALSLLTFAATVSYYFQTIDHIGRGRDGMPEATGGVESWEDVASLTWRGIVCIFVGVAPFLWWFWFVARHDPTADPLVGLSLLALGQAYMPAALLTVVLTDSNVGALWPPAWIQIIARAPAQYAMLVGLYLASLALGFVVKIAMVPIAWHVPYVGALVAGAAGNVLVFIQAALVGGFLKRNAEHFGYD
jgi:hypothetical protein